MCVCVCVYVCVCECIYTQTNKHWRDSYNHSDWHPKDFWDEMQDGEDFLREQANLDRHVPQPSAWEPDHENALDPGEVPNATWYMDWAKEQFREYWGAYYDHYSRTSVHQPPAPEALRVWEDIKRKEHASRGTP